MLTVGYFSSPDVAMLGATREALGQLALEGILAGAEALQGVAEGGEKDIQVITHPVGYCERHKVGSPPQSGRGSDGRLQLKAAAFRHLTGAIKP